jgi:hypothetical protein
VIILFLGQIEEVEKLILTTLQEEPKPMAVFNSKIRP